MVQERLEEIANPQPKKPTWREIFAALKDIRHDPEGRKALYGFFGGIAAICLLTGYMTHYGTRLNSRYMAELNQGNVPLGAIPRIQQTECADGRIKQKITIDDKTYCVFTTSDERKPYTAEPYSSKCECE